MTEVVLTSGVERCPSTPNPDKQIIEIIEPQQASASARGQMNFKAHHRARR